jgi:hypothetical protein
MLGGGFINAGVLFTVRIVLGKSGMIDSGIPYVLGRLPLVGL